MIGKQHVVHVVRLTRLLMRDPYLAQGGSNRQQGGHYCAPADTQQPRSHSSSGPSHPQHNLGGP